jgi:NodT family efflux transporter outer membrane factor (OMF) lipoprotein
MVAPTYLMQDEGPVLSVKLQGALRSRAALAITAAAALTCLSACNLGPRYRQPDVPPPAAWRPAEAGAAPAAAAAWPSEEWWHGFHSAQLDELMAEARRANDDIGAAIARVVEADEQARIAGAALLPALSADAGGTRQAQKTPVLALTPPNGALVTSSVLRTYNSFSLGLGASYQLDFWGRNRALHDAARMAALASRYDRATVELAVMTSVAVTYFQVLELNERLQVARDNLRHAQDILGGLQLELKVGTITALDVAQQETTVATLQAAMPPLQQQYVQTLDALAILVGRQPETLGLSLGRLQDLAEPVVGPGLPAELLTRRPDVAEAEAQLIAANADIRAARAAFLPTISLTADGGFASAALSGLVNPANRVFNASAGLTQPIFQGGALLGQYRLSKARYQELLSGYHKAVISAFANVEDALVAQRQSALEVERQQVATDKARRAYELSQAQMHAGIVNILTVLNTENALFSAQDALVQVRLAHLQSLVTLFGALGGGWQRS